MWKQVFLLCVPEIMNGYEKTRILFVCMGNICRSPMAEGVFRRLLEDAGLARAIQVDSAGTHSYHVGAAPDARSQATARRRGLDLSALRARRVVPEDFELFDYILAMDRQNIRDLLLICRQPAHQDKIRLLLEYAPEAGEREVPDPYYGGLSGFERVMDLVEEAAQGLLSHLREHYRL
jgi:protein-tyrosine phosphatase